MKKLLCVLMFGMVFGQTELTTRVYELPISFTETEFVSIDIEELTEDLNIQPKYNDKDMLLEAYRTYCHFIN